MSHRNGRGRGQDRWSLKLLNGEEHQNAENNAGKMANAKFRYVQEQILASMQKHLEQEYESSSSEEEYIEPEPILNSVVKQYYELDKSQNCIEKTRQFLEKSFESGAGICLICIANIKRVDPVWHCSGCYGSFHIICIQKWAKDSIFQQKQSQEDLPEFRKSNKFNWPCPKCRYEYEQTNIPQKYFCFCGKVEDPVYQPFIIPHSCGEKCYKVLQPKCGHFCVLLCHPGPCPPCPQTIRTYCHCGKHGPKMKRCNDKLWSCGSPCGKPLSCKKHSCENACHLSDCPPCNKTSVQTCNCGLQKRKQPCMTPLWKCDKVCGKPFSCGFHRCTVICHSGSCGNCPGSLERSCPCGKSVFKLPCTEEVPSCNETCGKLLECNTHRCPQKCHKDKCGMCLEITKKICRCGKYTKEVPCQKEFLCGTKCSRMKNCARHPCKRKCCDMTCTPCDKQCGRTLTCGNHKCLSICHSGRCYPCPELVQIKCRCGAASITVPCGREKKTKPPVCSSVCIVPPNCHHLSREPHRCHYGECPPCTQICGKDRKKCPHLCSAICHSSVWQKVDVNFHPSDPWEAAQVQYKRVNLPCPECEVPVPVTCHGGHETVDRPCYIAQPTSCSRPCGRLLKCGNHFCDKPCHQVLGSGDPPHAGENCSQCMLQCVRERPKGCTHKCLSPCHPGKCPPCQMSLKMKCHCAVVFIYVHCSEYFSSSNEVSEALLSCGSPCPKTYPCGHPCQLTCHSGDCTDSEMCKRKVKVPCKCGAVKKTVACNLLRSGTFDALECADCCIVVGEANTKDFIVTERKVKEKRKKNPCQGKEIEQEHKNSTDPSSAPSQAQFILMKYLYVLFGILALFSVVFFYVNQ